VASRDDGEQVFLLEFVTADVVGQPAWMTDDDPGLVAQTPQ
jgi:hypothetical protein